jgi:hypothetical protein
MIKHHLDHYEAISWQSTSLRRRIHLTWAIRARLLKDTLTETQVSNFSKHDFDEATYPKWLEMIKEIAFPGPWRRVKSSIPKCQYKAWRGSGWVCELLISPEVSLTSATLSDWIHETRRSEISTCNRRIINLLIFFPYLPP